ncbi:MAG: hypothetical protein AAGA56_24415, partial [Myxococcota bacterium]
PPTLRSFRQNLDPLLENGRFNPRGRERWGFPLDGGNFLTERSALCRTGSSHLVYGWGIEVSARTLAEGMRLAGCQYAVHLDMNPGHVGLLFYSHEGERLVGVPLTPEMSLPTNRFTRASPKDFFYLTARRSEPKLGGLTWTPHPSPQPPPAWLPASFQAKREVVRTPVELLAIDPTRYRWAISPGERERTTRAAEHKLDSSELAQAMVSVGLGITFRKTSPRGLVLNGSVAVPITPDRGLVLTDASGRLLLQRSVAELVLDGDASEVRLMAESGSIRPEARILRERRDRAAACQLGDGTVVLAVANFDTMVPPTQALLDVGCTRVLELDRGNQNRAFVHWAGSATPPLAHYDDTVLYGFAQPAPGRARDLQSQ